MDGTGRGRSVENDKPIAKPKFPLPSMFNPSKRSELPTRRPGGSNSLRQRAHFYRKDISDSGQPVYGFYITTEPAPRETPRR
jgi:hypothetical protein